MILPILRDPDPRLREKSAPVTEFDAALHALVSDMVETMYAAPGIGLAAPQIGVLQRVFVLDIAPATEPNKLQVFANPEILSREGELDWAEGCLSFPGVGRFVRRAASVRVRAQDLDGMWFELTSTDLLAVAIQHDLDHLDGVLMTDHPAVR